MGANNFPKYNLFYPYSVYNYNDNDLTDLKNYYQKYLLRN